MAKRLYARRTVRDLLLGDVVWRVERRWTKRDGLSYNARPRRPRSFGRVYGGGSLGIPRPTSKKTWVNPADGTQQGITSRLITLEEAAMMNLYLALGHETIRADRLWAAINVPGQHKGPVLREAVRGALWLAKRVHKQPDPAVGRALALLKDVQALTRTVMHVFNLGVPISWEDVS